MLKGCTDPYLCLDDSAQQIKLKKVPSRSRKLRILGDTLFNEARSVIERIQD